MCFAIGKLNLWLDLGDAVELGDVVGNLVVVPPVVVLGPRVELPVGGCAVALRIFHEYRAGVAEPDSVGRPVMEVYAGEVGAAALEDASCPALGCKVVDEDMDVFDAREVANDLGVDPGNGLEFSGPVFRVVRPGYPSGGVGSPLGGHAACGGCHRVLRALLRHRLLQGIPSIRAQCRSSRFPKSRS